MRRGGRRTKRRQRRENENETYTHISNYLFKPPSRHIDLHHNCDMNLDRTCMEMKCLKEKSIQMLLQWFVSIFDI